MTKINDHAARVARGAAYLDKVHPTWVDEVNLDILDLASGCNCVLGQIVSATNGDPEGGYYNVAEHCPTDFGYNQALELARTVGFRQPLSRRQAVAYGFHLSKRHALLSRWTSVKAEWEGLTAEWRKLIEARRAAT